MKQTIDAPIIDETLVEDKKGGFDLEGLKIDLGIECFKDKERNALSLSIPVHILKKIHPGETIFKIIEESSSLGAKVEGDKYIIAFPKDTPMEKIQEIIDEIQKRHIKLN
jgi:hypothetical protein